FNIALSFAVVSLGANMVRECSSPVACLRSLTEYAVLLPVICCSYLMPFDRSLLTDWLCSPKVLEPGRRQLRVAHGVLNVPVAQVCLQRPRIVSLVGQSIAAG